MMIDRDDVFYSFGLRDVLNSRYFKIAEVVYDGSIVPYTSTMSILDINMVFEI